MESLIRFGRAVPKRVMAYAFESARSISVSS